MKDSESEKVAKEIPERRRLRRSEGFRINLPLYRLGTANESCPATAEAKPNKRASVALSIIAPEPTDNYPPMLSGTSNSNPHDGHLTLMVSPPVEVAQADSDKTNSAANSRKAKFLMISSLTVVVSENLKTSPYLTI